MGNFSGDSEWDLGGIKEKKSQTTVMKIRKRWLLSFNILELVSKLWPVHFGNVKY